MRSVRTIRGRVGPMLGVLAFVPLAGLALLALGRINDVRATNQQLSQLDEETAELVQLVELEAALQNEGFWVGTEYGVRQTGYPPEVVSVVLGTDPVQEAIDAQDRTDELIAVIDMPGLAAAVDEARSEVPDMSVHVQAQDLVASGPVADALEQKVNVVVSLAAQQPDAASLVDLARTLERANGVRSSFSELRAAFFTSYGRVDLALPQPPARVLETRLFSYTERLDWLGQVVGANPSMTARFSELATDEARRQIVEEIELLLASHETTAGGGIAHEMPRLGRVAETFATAEVASVRHLEFVEYAARALQGEVHEARSEAQRSAWLVGSLAAAVCLVTIGAIVATTRWIVRPLTGLGRAAHALTEGGQGSLPAPSGPTEIRLIHEALDEAISNLERTELQAIALADGALDDPSLSQPVPGRFGATLHAAIEQLRHSIGHQEQFSDRLAYEAAHDGLTGLSNRRAALDHLRQALEGTHGSDVVTTVFFVDLDHFKDVNDTFGHAAGDDVLRSVANGLRRNARPGDMVGRIGGDEFLVVSTSLTSVEQATKLAERFLAGLKQSIDSANEQIGASIGVAMGEVGHDVDALLAEADVAMLDAKKHGRNTVRFFDAELRGRTTDELNLSADIRAGLAGEEFSLHLQPIVDSISGTVLDYEALIRWERPDVGLVPPDQYIPFAEGSDLVLDIDRWVLSEAVDIIASRKLDGVGVAVNISGRHLATGDLFRDLEAVLEGRSIDPSELTIEITESALLGDIDGAIETLRRIRDIGMKVAIDDFGTGFTSLTHLRSLPADVLKIDQSFTSNLDNSDDANLIRLVIQTAHILGLDVVVEGVETLHQAQRVTMLGADQMQGYFFARPLPLDQIARTDDGRPFTTTQTASHH